MKYLISIAVILFCSGYWVCNLSFKNGSVDWWDMRLSIYSLIFGLCFCIVYKILSGTEKAWALVGVVFYLGDIIDRYFFNIETFNYNDLLLYLFAFYYLRKHYARKIKTDSR